MDLDPCSNIRRREYRRRSAKRSFASKSSNSSFLTVFTLLASLRSAIFKTSFCVKIFCQYLSKMRAGVYLVLALRRPSRRRIRLVDRCGSLYQYRNRLWLHEVVWHFLSLHQRRVLRRQYDDFARLFHNDVYSVLG